MALAKVRALHPDIFVDDAVCEVSIPARWLFAGLWCYACDNGHLQDRSKQIKRWIYATDDVNVAELLRELEAEDLIERANGWLFIPGLTKRQRVDWRWFKTCDHPGCEKPKKKAESAGPERETRSGTQGHDEALRGHAPDVDVDVELDGDGDEEQVAETATAPIRDDVERICIHLADRIEANGARRPSIGKSWRNAARLMLDRDGRAEDQIHAAIDWCQDHEFWRANVLSLPKLREKYDTLRLQAQRRGTSKRGNDIDWDAAMEQARHLDEQMGQQG